MFYPQMLVHPQLYFFRRRNLHYTILCNNMELHL
jgi:hypothetical protein